MKILSNNYCQSINNQKINNTAFKLKESIAGNQAVLSKYNQSLPACYPIAFGKYKNVGETYVVDRATGEKQIAIIQRDSVGDFANIKLKIKGKEAGIMELHFSNDGDNLPDSIINKNKVSAEVIHLRSIKGDKYSGIGTALMKIAFLESVKNGCRGNLWLCAEKGYGRSMSKYRSDESPIPFYYKLGMRALIDKLKK